MLCFVPTSGKRWGVNGFRPGVDYFGWLADWFFRFRFLGLRGVEKLLKGPGHLHRREANRKAQQGDYTQRNLVDHEENAGYLERRS